jgi:hypothetical protein
MGGIVQAFPAPPAVAGVHAGMTMPFGANHATNRRGGVQVAAPLLRDQKAEGKNGSASVKPAWPSNILRELLLCMTWAPSRGSMDE